MIDQATNCVWMKSPTPALLASTTNTLPVIQAFHSPRVAAAPFGGPMVTSANAGPVSYAKRPISARPSIGTTKASLNASTDSESDGELPTCPYSRQFRHRTAPAIRALGRASLLGIAQPSFCQRGLKPVKRD